MIFGEFSSAFDDAPQDTSYSSAFASPNTPSLYDTSIGNFSSSTTSLNSMGTVSPQDLNLHDSFASAPPSTAYTALTSPDLFDNSPFGDMDHSPFIVTEDAQTTSGDGWYSLFPQDEQNQPQEQGAQGPKQASPELSPDEEYEVGKALKSSRKRSCAAASPGKRASVVGVNARKRDKPLPPIIVDDPTDTVAMKRARNTLAARKSRQRKNDKFEDLHETIARLTEEVAKWKAIALRRDDGKLEAEALKWKTIALQLGYRGD